jgi:hypothetical protein
MTDFEHWWYHEGSQGPNGMDLEEHCKRMCQIAWSNGAFVEREACAKVCEERLGPTATDFYGKTYAAAIRARSQK